MKTVKTSILIQAPIEHVWTILTEFDQYRNWNPFIIDASGQPVAGQKVQFRKAMSVSPIPLYSIVTIFDAEKYKFCWTTTWLHALLFGTTNNFTLEAVDEGSTYLTQFEAQQGLISVLTLQSMLDSLRSSMVSMNKALKRQAEDKKHRLPHSLTSGA